MKTVGIICEYNPFHLGHRKQFDMIRANYGEECAIVCLMSGNFVQRGQPAIFDKSVRAAAAIECGADLVLELPVTYALSSAEGFADGGVGILSSFCDGLCFGTESGNTEALMNTARALLLPEFVPLLKEQLENGCSFPAARQQALEALGCDAFLLRSPNDILAVEYCKAIIRQQSPLRPIPIRRQGNYHDTLPDPENPSATALRQLLKSGGWEAYVPDNIRQLYGSAPLYALEAGERAVLARVRTMSDEEFEALPYGSEGLWRKLMHACRQENSLEAIAQAVKSKRYTRTRIDRMLMCAYLGISREILSREAPYARVLAFSEKGKSVLKNARNCGTFPHVGENTKNPYQHLEQRCDDLYGLFRVDAPTPAGQEGKRRVYRKTPPK